MTKPELLEKLSAKSEISKTDVDSVLEALTEVLKEDVLGNGDAVNIPGLGAFKQKETAARTGRNPRTGESVQIAAKKKLVFKPAASMK